MMRPYTPFDKILDLKDKELRATKHALWMARALRAGDKASGIFMLYELWQEYHPKKPQVEYDKWKWVERKCLAKAREYE